MRTLTTKNFFDNPFDFLFTPSYSAEKIAMSTDIVETEKEFVLSINLAGFKKEEISLDLEKDILTISATKTEAETKTKYIRREMATSCQRSYRVGNAKKESITAGFTDGILTITIPKEQEKPNTKISIS